MAMSLNDLTKALRQDEFAARTDEELRGEAEKRVTENYNAMRGAAQQRQEVIDEAYARELQSLADTLATSQQAVSGEVDRANAAIDDYINTRSMQRTSYGASAKGSVQANMEKAVQIMMRDHQNAVGGVENKRILLAEQLKDTLARYDQDFLTDVQAYIDNQRQIDYDRKVVADAVYNDLQMQLFELGKAGSGGSGGGRRSSSGSGSSSKPTTSGSLFANLASRQVQATYNVNPTFGTTNQKTTGGTTYSKTNTTAKKSSNTYVSPSGKVYKTS